MLFRSSFFTFSSSLFIFHFIAFEYLACSCCVELNNILKLPSLSFSVASRQRKRTKKSYLCAGKEHPDDSFSTTDRDLVLRDVRHRHTTDGLRVSQPSCRTVFSQIPLASSRPTDFFAGHTNHQRTVRAIERQAAGRPVTNALPSLPYLSSRSEERRVGKECRSRWSPYH